MFLELAHPGSSEMNRDFGRLTLQVLGSQESWNLLESEEHAIAMVTCDH
jgi:hypothetical protein